MVDRLQKDLIFTSKSDKATLIASRVVRLYMGDVETHQYFELLRGGASDIDYAGSKDPAEYKTRSENMDMTLDGSSQSGRPAKKTGVISCRLPTELKTAAEALAAKNNVLLSHLLREFLEEAVRQDDPFWCARVKRRRSEDSRAQSSVFLSTLL